MGNISKNAKKKHLSLKLHDTARSHGGDCQSLSTPVATEAEHGSGVCVCLVASDTC